MKMQTSLLGLFATVGAASLMALNATAQDAASTPTAAAAAAPAEAAPANLPSGVGDIVKLTRAQVSEEVTLNYIRNSGTIYNLQPKDIVYLRNEGVSDRVINAMVDQRKNVPVETAAQAAAANAATSAQAPVSSEAVPAPTVQYVPTYVQPAPVYVQPEPDYAAASTLYVIPYASARFDYPNAFPYGYPYRYWGGYYPYCGSSVVYGYGYHNGGRWGGGYYGGHRGGGPYRHYGHR